MALLTNILGSCWVPTLFLICVTLFLRERSGSWFAPSTFIGALWCLYLSVSQLLLNYRVSPLGIWVLVILVIVIQLAATFGEMNSQATQATGADAARRSSIRSGVGRACWISLLVAFSGLVYFSISSVDLFDLPNTFDSLIRIGGIWTQRRYDGQVDPWPFRLAAVCAYPGVLFGGIVWGVSRKFGDKALSVASLLPPLLVSVLLGAREPFLIGFISWLGANWSTTRARTRKARKLFNVATVSSVVLAGGFLVFLFFLVFALRDAVHGDDLQLQVDRGQTYNYMFGPPLAFASWFEHSESSAHTWGGLTFAGAFDSLRAQPRVVRTYTDYANTVALENTNIFTVFRGLIQDFTLPGAITLCGVFGYYSGKVYSRPSWDPGFMLGLSAYYALALFSPLVSFFSSNSAIFAWVIVSFVLSALKPSQAVLTKTRRSNVGVIA